MDITDTTATADTIAEGFTAYGADGEKIIGKMSGGTSTINSLTEDGIVLKGQGHPSSVWGTDAEGNPSWNRKVIELQSIDDWLALPESKLTDGNIYKIVGDVTVEPAQLTNAPIIYTDYERVVGLWIDKKPLYRKVLRLNNIVTNGNVWADTQQQIENVDQFVSSFVLTAEQSYPCVCNHDGNVKFMMFRNTSLTFDKLIVDYTKSTDKPHDDIPIIEPNISEEELEQFVTDDLEVLNE